jgi:hypothetical protein
MSQATPAYPDSVRNSNTVLPPTPADIEAMIAALDAVLPRPSLADQIATLEASVDLTLRRGLALDARRIARSSVFADAATRRLYDNHAIVWG